MRWHVPPGTGLFEIGINTFLYPEQYVEPGNLKWVPIELGVYAFSLQMCMARRVGRFAQRSNPGKLLKSQGKATWWEISVHV